MNDEALKPCPFCQSPRVFLVPRNPPDFATGPDLVHQASCLDCGGRGAIRPRTETAREAWNQAGPKWISVEERLPLDGEWVLTWDGQKHRKATRCTAGSMQVWGKKYHGWAVVGEFDDLLKITHWQPLPAPPK